MLLVSVLIHVCFIFHGDLHIWFILILDFFFNVNLIKCLVFTSKSIWPDLHTILQTTVCYFACLKYCMMCFCWLMIHPFSAPKMMIMKKKLWVTDQTLIRKFGILYCTFAICFYAVIYQDKRSWWAVYLHFNFSSCSLWQYKTAFHKSASFLVWKYILRLFWLNNVFKYY